MQKPRENMEKPPGIACLEAFWKPFGSKIVEVKERLLHGRPRARGEHAAGHPAATAAEGR